MKPSFVPMMNRADLLLLVGLDCEHAFLPALIERARTRASRETVRLHRLFEEHLPRRCAQIDDIRG